jgi:pimeloyl-ACP methyl ester carboxylesterase
MTAPPQTRFVRTDEGAVAYQVFGEGPPTILFITSWFSNLDAMWDAPGLPAYFERLASFARVVCFDKRGSGVSDNVPLDDPPTLERAMDDAIAVIDAVGAEEVAVLGDAEGGPMAMLLAATYPERVTALVLVNSLARLRRADDYPIGMPDDTREKMIRRWEEHWGVTAEILGLTAPSLADDADARVWFQRAQRLAMPPRSAAVLYRWITAVDVRDVLGSIRAPTLVLHRRDARHHRIAFGRYLAEQIPDARMIELDGADTMPFHAGDVGPLLDEVERFLVGESRTPVAHRRLATILMSDVVGSTSSASELGDARWRATMRDHDRTVGVLLDRWRGELLAHTGDGILASFDGPTRAVTCARELVAALAVLGLNVRVGLHTGEVEVGPDGVGGLAIHLAAP